MKFNVWIIEVKWKSKKRGWQPTGAKWYWRRKDARAEMFKDETMDYRVTKYVPAKP